MTETKRTCYECGCIIEDSDDAVMVNGEYLCRDCYDDNYVVCDICGDIEHIDDTHYVNDRIICDYCLDRNYYTCECCGEYVERNMAYETRGGYICEGCYDRNYVTCNGCGDVIHIDDAIYRDCDSEYYCEDCYPDDSVINDYYHKPAPCFYGSDSDLYMGIELEIDGAGEDSNNAQNILDIDGADRIYCKHDGSLEKGFEIVSHPCTLDYHINEMNWSEIMQEAVTMGYTSHNAGTCGLHIHVSRVALGDSYSKQDETIANILYFIEKYWSKFLTFSRRTSDQLDRWARRYGICDNEKPADILKKAKGQYNRYVAVNLQNAHTIEFRFFRGTLKCTTFIATLQMVQHLCDMCTFLTPEDIEKISWNEFITSIENADADYSELLQYLNDRKIAKETL